jgi:uncharacterized repeat protein (TIGR04138 family)
MLWELLWWFVFCDTEGEVRNRGKNPVARSAASELAPLVRLVAEDRRYKLEAYQFVGAGLEYAHEVLGLGTPGPRRSKRRRGELELAEERPNERVVQHISGQELCHALRLLALEQYGYLAKLVLANWGIHHTGDFGEIVYNLIKIGRMSRSENDRKSDFDNVFDFEQAFLRDFAITKEAAACRPSKR